MFSPRYFNNPIRVPAFGTYEGVHPWVYLRTWSHYGGNWAERTQGGSVQIVVARQDAEFSFIRVWGLIPRRFKSLPSWQETADKIDNYLFSIGGELVPNGEWPDYWQGDKNLDKPEFSQLHWDPCHQQMLDAGYPKGLCNHIPVEEYS